MLAILTTHPIQYQVPLWQMLAADGRVPFEVWYLSEHATRLSHDREFGTEFAWDLDMLSGYRYRLLRTAAGATPNTFWRSRITESLPKLFRETKTKVLWVNGWQVAAYWQAVWAAHKAGVQVWMRGESNALREPRKRLMSHAVDARQMAKKVLLTQLFRRVDHFLCIGTANRELYRSYGVPESKLQMAMYAVDNERFAKQASELRVKRKELREGWGIPEGSFCILFCGKFIPKKHPHDLIKAAQLLLKAHPNLKIHLLFAGSGELGAELRAACDVVFDSDASQRSEVGGQKSEEPDNKEPITDNWRSSDNREPPPAQSGLRPGGITDNQKPRASFAGFLNQTQVSRAYVAADCLVLPSDYDETWGLVVNEAMASGLPCIISNRCGCAPDLGQTDGNAVYSFGNVRDLAEEIVEVANRRNDRSQPFDLPSFSTVVDIVAGLYA
jgi:glycosyltransferase involved in cell wall biosynthesis